MDKAGRELTIESKKDVVTMAIDWGSAVSSGTLAHDGSGELQFYMPSASGPKASNPITLISKDGKVNSVVVVGLSPDLTFNRKD